MSFVSNLRRLRTIGRRMDGPQGARAVPAAPPQAQGAREPVAVIFADEEGMPQIGLAHPSGRGMADVLTPVVTGEARELDGTVTPAFYGSRTRTLPIAALRPLAVVPPDVRLTAQLTAMGDIPEEIRDRARGVLAGYGALNARLRLCRTASDLLDRLNDAVGGPAYALDQDGVPVPHGSVHVAVPGVGLPQPSHRIEVPGASAPGGPTPQIIIPTWIEHLHGPIVRGIGGSGVA